MAAEVLPWLKNLPLAPEYHPTPAEFHDPISYIFKIEQEASRYGICKIVPPVTPQSKKTLISNLNRSFSASPKSSFATRQQQIGFCPRRHRPVQRPVWQSGERYTFHQFEAKAKAFERNYLKKFAKKSLSALEIETLFWKACVDKPFSVEYANDMPGSAFGSSKKMRDGGEALSVGETFWNMRAVSRAKGSLLRLMKEEIPGVTSPMVYIAMMFSWFAWHAEDHDLHSLNYMHMGAAKTWYGVPRDAAVAFEEVVRVQGYGGEINPLVTFAILGEKTTVMSPEVFIRAGIPCCRLVQNAGEFVVTFPRAYHSGFSHGFNFAEAANIATPGWLRVAKDAAVRRASINYPPMVSHTQLLYDLVLQHRSSLPKPIGSEPRSLRLKDRMKGEGETVLKELFVQDVVKNNQILHVLAEGCPIVLLPRRSSFRSLISHTKLKTPFCESERGLGVGESDDVSVNRWLTSIPCGSVYKNGSDSWTSIGKMETGSSNGTSEDAALSCVTCGALTFACCAIIQPREASARYFMSTDCSFFNDWIIHSGAGAALHGSISGRDIVMDQSKIMEKKNDTGGICDVPVQSGGYQIGSEDYNSDVNLNSEVHSSALGLLALTYGNQSDSDDDLPNDRFQFCGSGSRGENMTGIITKHGVQRDYSYLEKSNPMISRRSDQDSSRIHVFCVEHAVEVEQQLRPIGGVDILLVCHPDHPKFETEAKILAKELGVEHLWNDIEYREASEEDEVRIQNALESEEIAPGNGDWAVKLGINLYYSANLSRSPLYSKQMPYNSVIYSAFGRSPPAFSPTKPKDNSKNTGRQKKIVTAGKWCGKVWMSHQVHPFLAPKDPEDEEEEEEENFRPWEKLDERTDKRSERSRTVTVSRRTARKRKKMNEGGMRKPRPDIGDLMKALYDSPDHIYFPEEDNENVLKMKHLKRETPETQDRIVEDDCGGPSTRLRKRIVKKAEDSEPKRTAAKQQKKSKSRKSPSSKSSGRAALRMEEDEYQCDMEGCAMSFGSKQELALHKRNICPVKGCGKKFFSHKYLVQHRRVHVDDRPLKCPWKGCKMTFKWAWARTEHIRVHTGARPYICAEPGCGQTFRFVSDFSRHKRKTGHLGKKKARS